MLGTMTTRLPISGIQRRSGCWLGVLGTLWLLQGCVFVPVTTQKFDPECRVMNHTMELQAVQLASFSHCSSRECTGQLVLMGATAAATAVVSGSIVVVGNMVYWAERQGQCAGLLN